MTIAKRQVGILGGGALGKYLAEAILFREDIRSTMELAFIWNRSEERLKANEANVPSTYWLVGNDIALEIQRWTTEGNRVDTIVETSHPNVIARFGPQLLDCADLLVGSPSAFANAHVDRAVRHAAETNIARNGCYIATGAAWGVLDVAKMDALSTISRLTVSMTFPSDSFRGLQEPLDHALAKYQNDANNLADLILYEGPVRPLCDLAPNNVNTMACLSMAASELGFDKVQGRLIARKHLEAHIVEIAIEGPFGFQVSVRRYNPSARGAVTGRATFNSFLGSLKLVGGRGNGIFFC